MGISTVKVAPKDNLEVKELMADFLANASLKKLHEFINHMENDKKFKGSQFKAGVKRLFVSVAFNQLNVHEYSLNNRRQKAVVNVHQGKTYFFANTKDWENKDALYEKVYKLHKDVLLEMVETLESCSNEEVHSYAI
ncbi:hypothetical protein AB4Z22_00185 [Paenibacillus sp. TAF58]